MGVVGQPYSPVSPRHIQELESYQERFSGIMHRQEALAVEVQEPFFFL